jgi:catechol 2,3-dioxygenase-like lactoylglutathione lyase family enzyme
MTVQGLDHVGVVVDDLEGATRFFLDLGCELEGRAPVEGDWVDKVIGLDHVRAELVVVRTPDGSGRLEVSKFISPADAGPAEPAPSNRLGIRHIAFTVDDLDGMVGRLTATGTQLVGEVQNYADVYRLCYVRGPEGIIVELAQRLGSRRPD